MSDSFGPFQIDLAAIHALPEDERLLVLAEIAAIEQQIKTNKLWGFRPHEGERERKLREGVPLDGEEHRGQVEYLEMNHRKVHLGAVVAGNRFGKSEIGLVDNLIQILPPEFLPPWLETYRRRPYVGDYRCRTVVVDLPNALKKIWLPKMRRLIPSGALWKGDFAKAWNERDRLLTFADGSWWDFLTHDMDVDAFSGADLDRVHFDEEPPGSKGALQYDESSWRLIDRQGDMRMTMTPLLGFSWLYYELTTRDVPRKDVEVYVVEGSMTDNPVLDRATIARQVKRYEKRDPEQLNARLHGRFVSFAGLIFPQFRQTSPDKGGHVVAPREIPRQSPAAKPSVPIYGSIDPGVDHPAALVFFWLTEDDTAEVFYAQKWAQGDAAELVEEYRRVLDVLNFTPAWMVIDPIAKTRSFQTGRDLKFVLETEYSLPTILGQNSHRLGFNEIRNRLKTGRLLIHADQEEMVDEFKTYRWKTKKNQSEDTPKLEPVKRNDDLLDALRYGLLSLPQAAKAIEDHDPDEDRIERRLVRESVARMRRGRRERVGR